MADNNTQQSQSMPGMSGMSGMGDPTRAGNHADHADKGKGMDTPAPPMQTPGKAVMAESMTNMPMAKPKRVWTVTGAEDWEMLRGFGRAAGMVGMMNGMMVGGGPMQHMKMGKMDMSEAEQPAPSPEQARADGTPPPAQEAQAAAPAEKAPVKAEPTPVPAAPAAAPAANAGPVTITAALASGAAKVGSGNTLTVTVTDAQSKPVSGAKVTSRVAMTSMDMGTTHPAFRDMGSGKYVGRVGFTMGGPWRVTLEVTPLGGKPQTKSFDFTAK